MSNVSMGEYYSEHCCQCLSDKLSPDVKSQYTFDWHVQQAAQLLREKSGVGRVDPWSYQSLGGVQRLTEGKGNPALQ